MYTVTLWDLSSWKEVDIKIDERLCAAPEGSGQLQLLASKPSEDGELWVCYLEKALAIHCGGWDKLEGKGGTVHCYYYCYFINFLGFLICFYGRDYSCVLLFTRFIH